MSKKNQAPRVIRELVLAVKISEEEQRAFKAAAEKEGAPVSVWARVLLRRNAGLAQ